MFFVVVVFGGALEVETDWEREGETRGCEIVCMCVCGCGDAGEEEGQSEICNALLN